MKKINKGVYPTMITPFRDGLIDYKAVDQILDFYIDSDCTGVFAVCQSSEMVNLSLKEKVELSSHIVRYLNGRINVVASGHTSNSLDAQAEEINAIWKTGVDAVILVSNRFDIENTGDDDLFIKNAEALLAKLDKDVVLGIYECPRPYKRLLTPTIITWMIQTKKFKFIKDTCCNIETIKNRLELLKDSDVYLFNANAQTLFESIKCGGAGYSGIMANFHPYLYSWLFNNMNDKNAEYIETILSYFALIEGDSYPASGKYALQLNNINMTLECRNTSQKYLTPYIKSLVKRMHVQASNIHKQYCK